MKLKLLSVDILSIETLIEATEIFPNSPEIVSEWTQLIEPTRESSPLRVCFDGDKYWLFDGYHRLEAMKTLGFNRCDVIINRGVFDKPARWHGCLHRFAFGFLLLRKVQT